MTLASNAFQNCRCAFDSS